VTVNPRSALTVALGFYEVRRRQVPVDEPALAAAAANVAEAGWALLDWMRANAVDPGNPPSCACGGRHWSCPDADEDAEVCDRCGVDLALSPHMPDCGVRTRT
jgi:hypothetical protein